MEKFAKQRKTLIAALQRGEISYYHFSQLWAVLIEDEIYALNQERDKEFWAAINSTGDAIFCDPAEVSA